MDVIRCDKKDYLIWKWHPRDARAGQNLKENAIRWGSSLRVREGEVAVFVHTNQDGSVLDFIEGPKDVTLDTENLPVIARFTAMLYGGDSPFQAEIYFINLAQVIQMRFGVPYFDVADPRFEDFTVPVAVRGTMTFRIGDYRHFIKLHKLSTFTMEDFERQVRHAVTRIVKSIVSNAADSLKVPLVQVERMVDAVSTLAEGPVRLRMSQDFGVEVTALDISTIDVDTTSDDYRRLAEVTRDATAAMKKADVEDYVERTRINRVEDQYARHMQTQAENFAVYQTEAQAKVGIAGAEALGQAGAVGGSGGTSFNPAELMAGLALGSAVGQNLAQGISGAVGAPVPPPLPKTRYHVVANGKATGPYDLETLAQMADNGQLTAKSLVWKAGMQEWQAAATQDELAGLFPPEPPSVPEA